LIIGFEVEGQGKQGHSQKTWKRQEEKVKGFGYRRKIPFDKDRDME